MPKKILMIPILIVLVALFAGIALNSEDNTVDNSKYGKIDKKVETQKDDDNLFKKGVNTFKKKTSSATKWIEKKLNINKSKTSTSQSKREVMYGKYKVERVIDGDTFTISNGKRIRMLEVDTPESVNPDKSKNTPFGKEASKYTKKRLKKGTLVKLTHAVEKQDKYGRELCYVYLPDGTFYNRELIKKGYAKVLTIGENNLHEKEFRKLENKAKKERLGMWNE